MTILETIREGRRNGTRSLAILIDPEKNKTKQLDFVVDLSNAHDIDFFLVGGSLLMEDNLDGTITFIKKNSDIPIVLFPGNEMQYHPEADGIFFLSLISGRNPEYLIGKHVVVAPKLRAANLEVIPTGYILMHGSQSSTAAYISNTQPIPLTKPEIAVATAMAGEMLGQQLIYLEGGSGASRCISTHTITVIRQSIDIPLLVGGGIRNVEKLRDNYEAGADVQVIGTAFEKNPELIRAFAIAKKEFNKQCSKV